MWLPAHERDPNVIYAVDEQFRIVRCNRAWDNFALDNNGSAAKAGLVRGVSLFGVIPQDLLRFYDEGFQAAKQIGRWQHLFDCSSARIIRRLRMTVTPFASGFLIRNTTVTESLAPASERTGPLADYGPTVTMCCHCRRVENKKVSLWQWVPEFIERTPQGMRSRLCPACRSHHYGEASQPEDGAHSAA